MKYGNDNGARQCKSTDTLEPVSQKYLRALDIEISYVKDSVNLALLISSSDNNITLKITLTT